MSDLTLGALYGAVTLVVMFSGMPIAFALGVVATGFMYFFMPASSLDTVTQNVYEEMASITLLSIPSCWPRSSPCLRNARKITACTASTVSLGSRCRMTVKLLCSGVASVKS